MRRVLFYTIEALGRHDLHEKVFETIHPEPGVKRYDLLFAPGDDAQTLELQHRFAQHNGISAEDFDKARQSFSHEHQPASGPMPCCAATATSMKSAPFRAS